ncbi:MAG: cellulase family glycosylhydrolase [Acidobacteriaceae bacterium]|nr:cellulase family glycosylhydrolase [Acidobacteriaceae bacterium]
MIYGDLSVKQSSIQVFKKKKFYLIGLCGLIFAGTQYSLAQTNTNSPAPTDLSGFWVLHVPNGNGIRVDSYIEFHQNDNTITGTITTTTGVPPTPTPIRGTFQDGQVHFAAGGSTPFASVYDGAVQSGKIYFDIQRRKREKQRGIAERTTREASLPPGKLPLPVLRDLPDNGLVRTPPMGWNSWNLFKDKIDDATVRAMADAMVSSGMSKLGYSYINIDGTWEGGRDATGNLIPNKKFPDMKALVDYVHSKGLRIGIYSSPGPKTCGGYEGSYGHEQQDANTFAAWGFDYLKYDSCSARLIYPSTQENEQGLYQKMGEALQKTGRPIVYSLCEYGDADVWKWGSKTGGNLWRTTHDIDDTWASIERIGFSQIKLASYAKPGHWNDPDMLEIGNGGMNADEYRTQMSLWSLLSAPLIAGNDLRNMSEETKSILMNADVIAIDQDQAAKPVEALPTQGKVEILRRSMQDGSVVIGMFNRADSAANGTIIWNDVIPEFKINSFRVRDLWKHEAVTITGANYTASIRPHGVVLLRVDMAESMPFVTSGQAVQVGCSRNYMVTIFGSNFVPSSTLLVSGISYPVTHTSATELQAIIPLGAKTTSFPVSVSTPGSHASASVTVNAITPALQVCNGKLLKNGVPFIVKGVQISAFYRPSNGQSSQYIHYGPVLNARNYFETNFPTQATTELTAAKNWGANTIRLQVCEGGLNPSDPWYNAYGFLDELQQAVSLIESMGLEVIITNNSECMAYKTKYHMPNAATLAADQTLAAMFGNDSNVMLDLYNEPGLASVPTEFSGPVANPGNNWNLWAHGGYDVTNGTTDVGMQTIMNNLRSGSAPGTGPNTSPAINVILLEGLNFGEVLDGIPAISDPLNDWGAAIHPYLHGWDRDPKHWQTSFGFYADKGNLVIADEWGAPTEKGKDGAWCRSKEDLALPGKLLSYLQEKHIGVSGWAFDIASTLTLALDGTFAPNTLVGMNCGSPNGGPGTLLQSLFRNPDYKP